VSVTLRLDAIKRQSAFVPWLSVQRRGRRVRARGGVEAGAEADAAPARCSVLFGRERGDGVDLVRRQRDVGGREIRLEVPDARGVGDRQRVRGPVQLPGQGDLLRRGIVLRDDRIDDRVERPAVLAAGEGTWMPGREDDAGALGDVPHLGAEADGDVVVNGHRSDVGDRHRGPQLGGADVGQADVTDEAVLAHPGEGLDGLLERGVGHRRRVQVVEVDVIQPSRRALMYAAWRR
jgi:hypothetical protein